MQDNHRQRQCWKALAAAPNLSSSQPWPRRVWSALCVLILFWIGLAGPAAAYDKWITTNPWLEAGGRLTPSRCDGAGVDSQSIRYPAGSDLGYDFPERMRDRLLALGNASCVGKGNGVGACQALSNWRAQGACSVSGSGSSLGTVSCPYAVTMTTWEPLANGCGDLQRTDEVTDYALWTGKHCQAIDSYGQFDEESRNCYCGQGRVFVPEQGRCLETTDVLWIPHCDTCVGNPIYPAIGAKVQRFQLGWQPWYGVRATFNSIRKIPYDPSLTPSMAPADPSSLGGAWTTNFDKRVRPSNPSTARERLNVARGDGFSTVFRWSAEGFSPMQPQSTDSIQEKSGGGWFYRDAAAGVMELYDANGVLQSQAQIGGKTLTILRSDSNTPAAIAPQPGLPIELTDQDGRVVKLRFARPDPNGTPVLSHVMDPANGITELRYPTLSVQPIEIVNSDTTSTRLLYEDLNSSWALTGYLNENGVRAGTYGYDIEGRAVSTMRANGLDAYSVTWTQPARWSWFETYDSSVDKVLHVHKLLPALDVRLTYPTGNTESIVAMSSLDAVRWSRKTQQAGAGSAVATTGRDFDGRGNVTRVDDYNGHRSCMSYEATRNLESMRIEGLDTSADCATLASGALPSGARKVSTQWHPVWSLAVKTAEPGRITTLVYNGQLDPFNGNAIARCEATGQTLPDGSLVVLLCKRVEQATTDASGEQGFNAAALPGASARVWNWTYSPTGKVLTEKDPRGVTTVTNEYYTTTTTDYTKNDLKSSTNARGHVTTYPRYNAYGQPLEMVDANAVSTVYAYDARQRLKTATRAGNTTSYDYWPTGEIKRISESDGSSVNYEYDDARRLTAVSDALGNRIEYTLDASGNRTAEQAKDPQGTLKRTMSRVFDALGRAQQTTGRE